MRRILVLVAAFLLVSCDSAQRGGFLPVEPQYNTQMSEPVFLAFDPTLLRHAERVDSVRAVKGEAVRLQLEYQGIQLPAEERVFFELVVTSNSLFRAPEGSTLKAARERESSVKGQADWIKARLDDQGGYNVVLEPADLSFMAPAEITFSFRLRDFDGDGWVDDDKYVKDHFRLLSREDDGASWVALSPLNVSTDNQIVHVTVKILHFTRFAMATN
jgi:hypothetical protein